MLRRIVLIFLCISLVSSVQAASLSNYSVYPHKIFKCQQTSIYANYSDPGDIISVDALLLERNGTSTVVNMPGIPGSYAGTYGNDNATAWGNKSITFRVTNLGGTYTNASTEYVFVYSDECTGTNIQGYRNVTYRSSGFGNYTRPLFTGQQNLFDFAQQPYLNYFGFMIYLLITFVICGILYIKNQSVAQPLIIAFLAIGALVSNAVLPDTYLVYILFFMAAALTAIFWRLSKSA